MPVLRVLRKEDIDIRLDPDGEHVYVALFANDGYLRHERFPLSDFPNDFVTAADLERFGIRGK